MSQDRRLSLGLGFITTDCTGYLVRNVTSNERYSCSELEIVFYSVVCFGRHHDHHNGL